MNTTHLVGTISTGVVLLSSGNPGIGLAMGDTG